MALRLQSKRCHWRSLVQQYNGQLILLSVTDAAVAMQFVTHPEALQVMQSSAENERRSAGQYLQTKQKELQAQVANVQTLVAEGSPAEAIIDTAADRGADLIVMSSHGRGGMQRWTFGSVADKVVRHSNCPVLIVRQGTAITSTEQAES